jgi:hypothetical protein
MPSEILKKLTVRNALATGTIGVFLWTIIYGVLNIDKVSQALESSSLLSAFAGSFLTIVPIVYYFYFRKPQAKESTS